MPSAADRSGDTTPWFVRGNAFDSTGQLSLRFDRSRMRLLGADALYRWMRQSGTSTSTP